MEKQPIGSVFDWTNSSGPDENGYTSNKDIAQNRNGKKMGIYACVKCYKYLGHHENDIWEVRYWEHIDQPGPCLGVGYTGCHVLAIYEAFYCPECEAWKRGDKAVSYGYYDYSNGVKWIPLVQWQIDELNLAF